MRPFLRSFAFVAFVASIGCAPAAPATSLGSNAVPVDASSAVDSTAPVAPAVQSPAQGGDGQPTETAAKVDIVPLAENVWLHTSRRRLAKFGLVPSNGLVVRSGSTVYLIDTAWTDAGTRQILHWVKSQLGAAVSVAVVTHAHMDKMGGMAALHEQGVVTHAHPLTNRDAPGRNLIPANQVLQLDGDVAKFDNGAIEVFYPGPGHTVDNIVVYLKHSDVLFGGCLIRARQTNSIGNTADADTAHWPHAVERVKARYPQARIVVPSHGVPGDAELLSHTIALANDYLRGADGGH